MTISLKIIKLDRGAHVPKYAHSTDAGLDLHALHSHTIQPFERILIPTGIAFEIPTGYAGFILPRSGLSSKFGLTLINSPGLIDSGYRGEICIAAVNLDPHNPVEIQAGDRVAQLVLLQTPRIEIIETSHLSSSERGVGGFGSSGFGSATHQ